MISTRAHDIAVLLFLLAVLGVLLILSLMLGRPVVA